MTRNGILRFLPKPYERLLAAGMTGTGKTVLVRHLLEAAHPESGKLYRPYAIVHDGKGTLNWHGWTLVRSLARAKDLDPEKHPRIIYRPNPAELVNPEPFFAFVYERRNCVCYVDETYAVCVGNALTFSHLACLTRGRELKIEMWHGTQRPKRIPQEVMSEAEVAFLFRLQMPQDRKRIYDIYGIHPDDINSLAPADPRARRGGQFFYKRVDADAEGPHRLVTRTNGVTT